jgi:hypothetical protein
MQLFSLCVAFPWYPVIERRHVVLVVGAAWWVMFLLFAIVALVAL